MPNPITQHMRRKKNLSHALVLWDQHEKCFTRSNEVNGKRSKDCRKKKHWTEPTRMKTLTSLFWSAKTQISWLQSVSNITSLHTFFQQTLDGSQKNFKLSLWWGQALYCTFYTQESSSIISIITSNPSPLYVLILMSDIHQLGIQRRRKKGARIHTSWRT